MSAADAGGDVRRWLGDVTRRVEALELWRAGQDAAQEVRSGEQSERTAERHWLIPVVFTAINTALVIANLVLSHR